MLGILRTKASNYVALVALVVVVYFLLSSTTTVPAATSRRDDKSGAGIPAAATHEDPRPAAMEAVTLTVTVGVDAADPGAGKDHDEAVTSHRDEDTDRNKDKNEAVSADVPKAVEAMLAFPKQIHFTLKDKHNIPSWANISSWRTKNPDYEVRLWDDADAKQLIMETFPEQFTNARMNKLKPVEMADIFRYVVMYKHGGVYSDIDVGAVLPIPEWLVYFEHRIRDLDQVNAVIGVEGDCKGNDAHRRAVKFVYDVQYCQWTMAFKPGHPMLPYLMDIIAIQIDKNAPTLYKTGPGPWTDAVNKFKDSLTIISPTAFAVGGACSEDPSAGTAVRHQFAGSWKGWHKW